MALRASMNPSRGRQLPGSCQDLESGKETSVHGYEGREAAAGCTCWPARRGPRSALRR